VFPVLEVTRATPEENLAFDDELLAGGREVLRLWESPRPFVVLGRSCRVETDVHVEACAAEGVPVLRRSSGGGTVVLGPGCLNYSLVLSRPGLMNVVESYGLILGAVVEALGVAGLGVEGTDLVLGGRKVAGCAQRRSGRWLLHHGTILCEGVDLARIGRLLKEPPRQPLYRAGRPHADFLAPLMKLVPGTNLMKNGRWEGISR
jgi:lipoate-protein ligase A